MRIKSENLTEGIVSLEGFLKGFDIKSQIFLYLRS